MAGVLLDSMPILSEILAQLARLFGSLETYVPSVVVRHIMAGRDPNCLLPTRVCIVMMATDIVCFTRLSEGAPVTEVAPLRPPLALGLVHGICMLVCPTPAPSG